MNKLLLIACGLALAVTSYAQGLFNANNNYTPLGASAKAFVLDPTGLPLAKALGRVEILNAADQSSLSPGGAAGVAFLGDGLFIINNIAVPGAPIGGSANIVIRAWDSSSGATWAEATSKISGLVTVTSLGGGTTPNATLALNSGFVGLQIPGVPEPSVVALATLGIAGLFFMARRKS